MANEPIQWDDCLSDDHLRGVIGNFQRQVLATIKSRGSSPAPTSFSHNKCRDANIESSDKRQCLNLDK